MLIEIKNYQILSEINIITIPLIYRPAPSYNVPMVNVTPMWKNVTECRSAVTNLMSINVVSICRTKWSFGRHLVFALIILLPITFDEKRKECLSENGKWTCFMQVPLARRISSPVRTGGNVLTGQCAVTDFMIVPITPTNKTASVNTQIHFLFYATYLVWSLDLELIVLLLFGARLINFVNKYRGIVRPYTVP